MSIPTPRERLDAALTNAPQPYRQRTIDSYLDLKRRLAEGKYEASGLSNGKFCEVVLRLLQHEVLGSAAPFGKKIANFTDECRKLITATSSRPETLRVIVPRALAFLYTIRNKRGVGHVGGDVDANRIDSATTARLADWVVCELIRVYHKLSLEEAQDLVDSLAERDLPDIWSVAGRKRVLREGTTKKQQALLLLYSEPDSAVPIEDLATWVEYSSLRDFRLKVVTPLHKDRYVEYDTETDMVYLSPKGVKHVEQDILR